VRLDIGDGAETIWVVWAQYSDRSDDPELIAAYLHEPQAISLKDLIDRTGPVKSVKVTPVPLAPLLKARSEP